MYISVPVLVGHYGWKLDVIMCQHDCSINSLSCNNILHKQNDTVV